MRCATRLCVSDFCVLKSGERYPLGMRNWLLLSLALLGCSEDPDVVVYVVASEGGNSSVGGSSEAQEAALSAGGKSVDASYTVATAAGGSSQMSSSQGGSSAVAQSSTGGSSAQTSQTSRALTVSFGGMPPVVTLAPISMGGSTQASAASVPNAPQQDCKFPGTDKLCGPASMGSRMCNANGECVKIDFSEKKLDCNYDGVLDTPVDDSNCSECGYACKYNGTKCTLVSEWSTDNTFRTYWSCALPAK